MGHRESYPHARCGYVTYVYVRRPARQWVPWLVVCDSALLAELGIEQLGLYAAHRFGRDDLIARYEGNVVGRFQTREAAMRATPVQQLVSAGVDTLLARRSTAGWDVVDGHPFLQYVNDPRGTRYECHSLCLDVCLHALHARGSKQFPYNVFPTTRRVVHHVLILA